MVATENVTELLRRVAGGDRQAEDSLVPLIYPELRRLAAARMRLERTEHTLQPTALVNEMFLRLPGAEEIGWKDRAHFFRVAAENMRRILVDHARKRNAQKRPDGRQVPLDDELLISAEDCRLFEDLDSALRRLAEIHPRQAKVVEFRYFSGMTDAEITEVLGVSDKTVKRDWMKARAWLYGELGG